MISLRYFNPVGAHSSGSIGEDPNGEPNNLMPYISQVAVGRRKNLNVYGTDYDTKDGTGVRDYIHITDLAEGHVCALKKLGLGDVKGMLLRQLQSLNEFLKISCGLGFVTYNLGTGIGYSVLEVVEAFTRASKRKVDYVESPRYADLCVFKKIEINQIDWFLHRRPGDIATSFADAALAEEELGWKAKRGLKEMCEDTWKWQRQNPNGFSRSQL